MIFSDIKQVNASAINDTFSVSLVGPALSIVSLEEPVFVGQYGIEDDFIPERKNTFFMHRNDFIAELK
jgi:hypothetical protein